MDLGRSVETDARTHVIVQKFGGTSVSTPERRAQVVGHVRRAREAGYAVALVVSAMGRRGDPYATDTLLDLLRADGGPVDPADYNTMFVTGEIISAAVVSHTLKRAGIPAVPLSGVQARIYTEGHPLEAEVADIDTSRLRLHLERGEVPVVTGGQGAFRATLDFATLGRGASDTSGVVLGVALGAERVEIFTDVAGVATTDPRLVAHARWVRQVSYKRMYELARFGAKVVHPRAILAGWRGHTPVVVRSTFSLDPGTLIGDVADEGPVLGLATLCPMDTRIVAADGVDEDRRSEWERQRLIMCLTGETSGTLVLGVPAANTAELDRTVSEAGLRTFARFPDTAWVTVVGEEQELQRRRDRDRRCLELAGVERHADEFAPGRSTVVVPAASMGRCVGALYEDIFG
jgi:uridylate kinase